MRQTVPIRVDQPMSLQGSKEYNDSRVIESPRRLRSSTASSGEFRENHSSYSNPVVSVMTRSLRYNRKPVDEMPPRSITPGRQRLPPNGASSNKIRQPPTGSIPSPARVKSRHVRTDATGSISSPLNSRHVQTDATASIPSPLNSRHVRTDATASIPSPLNSRHVRTNAISDIGQTSGSGAAPHLFEETEIHQSAEMIAQEQALFEQRLCDDDYGVAVRKINQNGKSSLRYVKCITVDIQELDDDGPNFSSNRSVSSFSRGSLSFLRGLSSKVRSDRSVSGRSRTDHSVERNELIGLETLLPGSVRVKVLTWGKKKDVKIPLEKFVSIRKGKTTDRTRRNPFASSRILSLITNDPFHPSLDIEAPTRVDRDKFARAFSIFLKVPLEEGAENRSARSDPNPEPKGDPIATTYLQRALSKRDSNNGVRKNVPMPVVTTIRGTQNRILTRRPTSINDIARARMAQDSEVMEESIEIVGNLDPQILLSSSTLGILSPRTHKTSTSVNKQQSTPATVNSSHLDVHASDDGSAVSSITGAGFDQEIVEELHMALTTLRAELDESRAEATRAVKVAEQAIKSAENSNSKDWNSTVTHKAAEAAALAQKRSAEALSRARLAEERLETEQKNAAIWKKQAQAAEEEAGFWQTRAAAAEVHKATITQSLESERNKTAALLSSMDELPNGSGKDGAVVHHSENIRALEAELESMRSILASKADEVKSLRECLTEVESTREAYQALRKKPGLISKIQNVQIQNIQQLSPSGYLAKVPSQTALTPQSEVDKLRSKLAMETAARRKLLNEVQDLRGAVRVYCRLRAPTNGNSILSVPAHEVVLLHRERAGERIPNTAPLSFEFDGVIASDMDQHHLYSEVEELCLNALDGFNVCVIVYGQSGSGKTFAMLGDVGYSIAVDSEPLLSINDFGIHLRAAKQIFSVLKYRSGRFKDVVTFSIVEVYDERISDLLAGTEIGESQGRMESRRSSSRRRGCSIGSSSSAMGNSEQPIKLEIRTNHKGETVVQGSLSVEVKSFEEICRVWKECLGKRVSRLAERGVKLDSHDRNCHIIGTMRVFSTNLSTGVGTQGKIQFVDLAGSDVVSERSSSLSRRAPSPGRPSGTGRELKYSNKSIATLSEVVHARSQYQRTVPYRNSTITHLLSDSLEGDTKVAMVACVSSDLKDLQETACTLKLAQSMRKVIVGKATKHALGRGRS